MRRSIPLSAVVLAAVLVAGCGAGGADDAARPGGDGAPEIELDIPDASAPAIAAGTNASSPSAEPSPSEEEAPVSDEEAQLLHAAAEVVDALRSRDLIRLAGWIDPASGVRFAPYAYIDAEHSLVFPPDGLPNFKDDTKLTWGAYDGSGEPIELSFRDYFEQFVYDHDYAAAPSVSANRLAREGNAIYNGGDVYPDSSFVEFHFPGFDKKLEGMDWKSLILVFRPVAQEWKLCAIVHSQWTI